MALVIPTTVAILQATSYHPPEDYTEDHPSTGAPLAEPPQPSGAPAVPAAPAPAAPAPDPAGAPAPAPSPAPAPATAPGGGASLYLHYHWSKAAPPPAPGLFDLDAGALSFAVPAVQVLPSYSNEELARYGLVQHEELRLPVFAATF